MNRRQFLAHTGSLALSLTMLSQAKAATPQPPAAPNIVYIIADDLGWNDVGFHGSEIKTPNIDRLAREGIVLDRFYVCPICSPTRAGVLTGRYPVRFDIQHGVISPNVRHGMPPAEFTLPEMLARAGYDRRVMIGKWHLGLASTLFHPLRHGFTDFYGHYNGALDYFSHERFGQLDWHRDYDSSYDKGYSTDLVGAEAVRWIRQSDTDSPFFLHINFNAPHSPIQAKEEDLKAYGFDPDKERAPHTDAGLQRRENAPNYGAQGRGNTVRQTFSAMTTAMDRQVGNILTALDEKGLSDNTLVVFHSDNGGIPAHGGSNTPLRGNKMTTWEGGVRVVAMMRWPGRLQGGRRFDRLMGYIDMWPTLADAAGFHGEPVNPLDGVNMLPILAGKQQAPDRTFLLGDDAVVTQRYKLVRGELFAIDKDPNEKTDIAAEHPDIVAELSKGLARFQAIKGPPFQTSLPEPDVWPPHEWKLPEE